MLVLTISSVELSHQILGASGHCLPCVEEKAVEYAAPSDMILLTSDALRSLSSLLSPRSDRFPVLHPIDRSYPSLVGADHFEPHSSRRYVLVLFSSCPGYSNLVERMDHQTSNHTVCYRFR